MKRGKKMILLLGLLCVLLGGYALLGQMNEKTGVSETRGSYPLWKEGKTVSSLSWEKDGEAFAFSMGESVWMKDGDSAFPVNQTAVQNLADKVAGLTAVSELADVTSPADYGLDEPAFTVTVKDEAGSETVYAMGDQTPFEDGYYLSVSGNDHVYVIGSSLSSVFNKTMTQLAVMETIPEVTAVTRMTVGDTLDVTYDEAQDVWSDTATGEVLDGDAVAALAESAKSLSWGALTDTGADDEALSAWALDDAQAVKLTLYNGGTAERTLLLGGADEAGDRYARLPDSRMVYTLSSEDTDALLGAGVDTLYMKKLRGMTAEEISGIAFDWGEGQKTLTGEDGESSVMQGIIEQLAALEGTERVALGELGGTVLKIDVTHTDAAAQTLSFHAYSVDSYLLPITGTHGMLVPAEDVDKLIRMLKQEA